MIENKNWERLADTSKNDISKDIARDGLRLGPQKLLQKRPNRRFRMPILKELNQKNLIK